MTRPCPSAAAGESSRPKGKGGGSHTGARPPQLPRGKPGEGGPAQGRNARGWCSFAVDSRRAVGQGASERAGTLIEDAGMVEKMPDRSVLFGDAVVEITDPLRVQPASADALVEFRYTDGILCLSFATYVIDGSGPPTLTVCSRLRIALPGAMHLRDALNSAIADIIPGKDKAN